MLMAAIGATAILAVALVIYRLFFSLGKDSKLVARVDGRPPFALERITGDSAEFVTRIGIENLGGQYATVMDCIVRPQLPFEQYDGIEARGKAEVDGKPREDDYFEAVLVGAYATLPILVKVKLTARKGMDIRTALSRMVDLPLDIIYTELGRRPWKLKKIRIVLTAEEIAALAGVALSDDGEGARHG